MKSYYSVSLSDLITTKEWMDAEAEDDQLAKEFILYQCGLDVHHPDGYEEEYVTHRNWQNQVTTCVRYTGVERLDYEWLSSGMATMEAHMAAADVETRKDMVQMSRQSRYAHALKRNGGDE